MLILAMRLIVLVCLLVVTALGVPVGVTAQTFSLGASESSQFVGSEIVASPQPVIPAELHEQCFKSCCIARFVIDANGKSSVKLLTSSGSDDIDNITVSTLKRWKFRPAMLNGRAVQSSRRVKIEFEIQ